MELSDFTSSQMYFMLFSHMLLSLVLFVEIITTKFACIRICGIYHMHCFDMPNKVFLLCGFLPTNFAQELAIHSWYNKVIRFICGSLFP